MGPCWLLITICIASSSFVFHFALAAKFPLSVNKGYEFKTRLHFSFIRSQSLGDVPPSATTGWWICHIIKTTCHKKIALEASWIAHSWNKVQEFSASVEEAHPWLIIGIWVLDWMAHHWSWLSSLHSWIPCLILRASSDLLDIISLYSKYFKVCSSFCFVAL